MKTVQTVPFTGTKEQEQALRAWLKEHEGVQGITMQALQYAQSLYGYLPREVLIILADSLSASLEDLYGIITFYSQFRLAPTGQHKISVCLGTACYVKGASKIHDRLAELLLVEDGETTPDGKFTLENTRCIGACGLAPVMTVDKDVYGRLSVGEVDAILAKY